MKNNSNLSHLKVLFGIALFFLSATSIFAAQSPGEQALKAQLETTIDLSAIKTGASLEEAIEHIQNRFDPPLPIVVDWDALAVVGVGPTDRASTRGWVKTTAGEALQTILYTASKNNKEALPDYAVRDSQIIITDNPRGLIRKTYTLADHQKVDVSGKPLSDIEIREWFNLQLSEFLDWKIGDHLFPVQQIKVNNAQITILQTPENHKLIAKRIAALKSADLRHILIEARLITAPERFCEEIGLEAESDQKQSGIASIGPANSDSIRQTLKQKQLNEWDIPFNDIITIDDDQSNFVTRATQAHRNSKTITGMNTTILNDSSAVMNIPTYYTYTDTDGCEKKTEGGVRITLLPTISEEDNTQIQFKGRILFSEKLDDELQTTNGSEYAIPRIQVVDFPIHTTIENGKTALLYQTELALTKEEKEVLQKMPIIGRGAGIIQNPRTQTSKCLLILIKARIVDRPEPRLNSRPSCQSSESD